MKATVRHIDAVTVVDLSGRITIGEPCRQLHEIVGQELGKGHHHLLLNLADVTYIDSSGIGELVRDYTAVSSQGGQLKLLHLTRKVHDLLQITKLYTVFDIHEDEAHAISSFVTA